MQIRVSALYVGHHHVV